jgi:hypothetical protein
MLAPMKKPSKPTARVRVESIRIALANTVQ